MKKIHLGILSGIIAGIIDIILMLIQKLSWDANLSAFSMWIISGFLISTTILKINSALKGILISFLILIPNLFIIGLKEPFSLLPVITMTLILGSMLGYLIDKYGDKK